MKLAQSMTDMSSLEEAEKHIMLRAGIDLSDFDDLQLQELIGVFDEVHNGLDCSDDDDENSSNNNNCDNDDDGEAGQMMVCDSD